MKCNKILGVTLALVIGATQVSARDTAREGGNASQAPAASSASSFAPADGWVVSVRQMPEHRRNQITKIVNKLDSISLNRSLMSDVFSAAGMGIVSGIVDVIVSETYNLAQYRKKQKEEWNRMIQNENNYTDSITFIKGLKDFYIENSCRGALDPSDINFDGIEIRGMRDGNEVIYMACSIDSTKLEHMFRHSKFNLVLDTLAFNPYQCHLPNVTANGIRIMKDIKEGKAEVRGDTIVRPGVGGNSFSFDERKGLRVALDFSLYSSWINEAIQVHRDVSLGDFSLEISIPDSIISPYTYSRRRILAIADTLPDSISREVYLAQNILPIEGDSFVVPRSFMPNRSGEPRWGTGEYNIKLKIRESCQFKDESEKAKHWREDYKRLRLMQKRSGEVREYFQTLWSQYGNSLVKATYKTALSTAATDLVTPLFTGGASSAAGAGAGASSAAGASQQAAGAPTP